MAESTIVRDYFASAFRTVVAGGVGTALAYLARKTGIVVDEQTGAGLVQGFTFIVITAYYLIVRGLETKIPAFGWLLGLAKLPTYASPTGTVPAAPDGSVPLSKS